MNRILTIKKQKEINIGSNLELANITLNNLSLAKLLIDLFETFINNAHIKNTKKY